MSLPTTIVRLIPIVLLFVLVPLGVAAPPIELNTGPVEPSLSQSQAGTSEYVIVQANSSTRPASIIDHSNGDLYGYIPEHAWYARVPIANQSMLLDHERIQQIIPLQASHRIAQSVKRQARYQETLVLQIDLFPGTDNDTIETISEIAPIQRQDSNSVTITADREHIQDLAEIGPVKQITWAGAQFTQHNDAVRDIIGTDWIQDHPFELTGEGFSGAIWDAGCALEHEDLNASSKLLAVQNGCSTDYHAVHVAATMLGNGTINGSYRGMAPDAGLATYQWPGSGDEDTLYNETNHSIQTANAVVSQNSWGYLIDDQSTSLMGAYVGLAPDYDTVMRGGTVSPLEEQIPVVFSAGNEGTRTPRYNTTVGPGGTAKNIITVGAVRDDTTMTSYSSWGPTDDGRIKPTIVGPGGSSQAGSLITSAIPPDFSLCGPYPCSYPYDGLAGTSMAAPVVSGTLIQLTEYVNDTHGSIPAPATLKGVLVQTATDLETPGPDFKTGWGLINASEAVSYLETNTTGQIIHRGTLSQATDEHTYTITADPSADSLNFTLAWSDYPAQTSVEKTLVNDLDLVITNSTGHRFYPWTKDGYETRGQPAAQDSSDHRNPIEQVTIWDPQDAEYQVTVTSIQDTIPEPPQSYSLLAPQEAADEMAPSIMPQTPSNDSIISNTRWINASGNDASPIATFNATVSNTSGNQLERPLNTSVNTSDLDDGRYMITYEAIDIHDNRNTVNRTVWIDNDGPNITVQQPQRTVLNGTFSLNATWAQGTTARYQLKNDSGVIADGQLNASIDTTALRDGRYTIRYNGTAGGQTSLRDRSIVLDTTPPTQQIHAPNDQDATNESFKLNSTQSDATTTIRNRSYRWLQDDSPITDWQPYSTNQTILITGVSDGRYNLSLRSTDQANNSVISTLTGLTIDTEAPNATQALNLTTANWTATQPGRYDTTIPSVVGISWEQASVDAFTDIGSGIDTITVQHQNRSLRDNGTIGPWSEWRNSTGIDPATDDNTTLTTVTNTSYAIRIMVEDEAGNTNTSNVLMVGHDQTPPAPIMNMTDPALEPYNWTNLTTIRPNATITDLSAFTEPLSLHGNLSLWNTSSSSINTTTSLTSLDNLRIEANESIDLLANTSYTLSLDTKDSHGYNTTHNWTIRTDFAPPSITTTRYPAAPTESGWYRTPVTIEQTCSEPWYESGPARQRLTRPDLPETPWNQSTIMNTTLTTDGGHQIAVTCVDVAGNRNSTSQSLSIDLTPPTVTGTDPADGATEIDTAYTATISFTDQAPASGIDTGASQFSLTGGNGDITDTAWSNTSVSLDISGLQDGTEYELSGTLHDHAGHEEPFSVSFKTESDDTSPSSPSPSTSVPDPPTTPERPDVTAFFETIEPGTPIRQRVNRTKTSITRFDLATTESGSDVGINVSATRQLPAQTPRSEHVYEYLDINATNIADSEIESANLSFRINRSWIRERSINISSIRLQRYRDEWEVLPTRIEERGPEHISFRARTPGFSTFAITADTNRTFERHQPDIEATCGDGTCDSNETWETCKIDCDPPQIVQDALSQIQTANRTIDPGEQGYNMLEQAIVEFRDQNYEQASQLARQALDQRETQRSRDITPFFLILLASLFTTLLIILYEHDRS